MVRRARHMNTALVRTQKTRPSAAARLDPGVRSAAQGRSRRNRVPCGDARRLASVMREGRRRRASTRRGATVFLPQASQRAARVGGIFFDGLNSAGDTANSSFPATTSPSAATSARARRGDPPGWCGDALRPRSQASGGQRTSATAVMSSSICFIDPGMDLGLEDTRRIPPPSCRRYRPRRAAIKRIQPEGVFDGQRRRNPDARIGNPFEVCTVSAIFRHAHRRSRHLASRPDHAEALLVASVSPLSVSFRRQPIFDGPDFCGRLDPRGTAP